MREWGLVVRELYVLLNSIHLFSFCLGGGGWRGGGYCHYNRVAFK